MATRERTRTPKPPPGHWDDFPKTATARLRWLVKTRGLTPAVISTRGGLTVRTIQRYLRHGVPLNQSGPSFAMLCRGTEAGPGFLLGYSDIPNGRRRR